MHFTAFFRKWEELKNKPSKWIYRTQAEAEKRQEQNHHLHDNKFNLMQNEQGSSEA